MKLTRRNGECEEGSGGGEQQYPNRVSAGSSSARPRRGVASNPVTMALVRLHIEDHVRRLVIRQMFVLVVGVVRDAGRRGNASTSSWPWRSRLLKVAGTAAAADCMVDCRAVIHGLQKRPLPCHRGLRSSACPRRNDAVPNRDCGSASTSAFLTYGTQRSQGSAAARHHHDLPQAETPPAHPAPTTNYSWPVLLSANSLLFASFFFLLSLYVSFLRRSLGFGFFFSSILFLVGVSPATVFRRLFSDPLRGYLNTGRSRTFIYFDRQIGWCLMFLYIMYAK